MAGPRKRKVPADKRKVVNFEQIEQVKSLANLCIEVGVELPSLPLTSVSR